MRIRISAPGNKENGYVLLDVMVALFVALIGFTAVFGAIKSSIDYSVKRENILSDSILLRNEKADNFELILTY